MGTAVKYPVLDRVKLSIVIFDIWALLTLSVRVLGCQKLLLNPVWLGCFIAVHIWQQWASKGCRQMAGIWTV